MLRVARQSSAYIARFISAVGIYHCIGARAGREEDILRSAYQQGDMSTVNSLRRDDHEEQPTCWLHDSSFCLSKTAC
jgi:hypothetical protein